MSVNLLLSYAFHARTNLAQVRSSLVCGRLMIDSGAFTAWSKGRPIDLDAYAEYLERWRGCWDHAVTLDVIGDGKASARNTRKLHERGLPVMPVFTRGDTLAEFDAMVRDVGYVCVGGLVGLPGKTQLARVRMLQRRALDSGGGIHALGIGSLATLRAARPYSADASSVSGAFKFGTLVYFDGRSIRNVALSDRAKLARDRDHLRAHGIDLGKLAATRKMPGQMDGRQALMRAMSLAYAAADEWLKITGPVRAPESVRGPGTHLYNSVGGGTHGGAGQAKLVAGLDADLHPSVGPHLYNSVVSPDAKGAASTDELVHGPHLYSSVGDGWLVDAARRVDRVVHDEPPLIWRRHGAQHHRWCRAGGGHPSEGSASPASAATPV